MTDGDFEAEEYRQQRQASKWPCLPTVLGAAGLLALFVKLVRR